MEIKRIRNIFKYDTIDEYGNDVKAIGSPLGIVSCKIFGLDSWEYSRNYRNLSGQMINFIGPFIVKIIYKKY